MDIYSTTLLIAMLVAGAAALGTLGAWLRSDGFRLARGAQYAGLLSMLFGVVALILHLVSGHRPGTATSLSVGAFLGEHPAPLVTILIGAVCTWLAGVMSSRPSRDRDRG